jgi:hypothetical protein
MNVSSPYRVRIVVDSMFGDRLAELPADEPVWIINSPVNTPVAQRLWTERPDHNHLTAITTFRAASGNEEDDLLCILGTVDEHHGQYSADPPYSEIEVIGCCASEQIIAALSELGFVLTSSIPEGFHASRRTA